MSAFLWEMSISKVGELSLLRRPWSLQKARESQTHWNPSRRHKTGREAPVPDGVTGRSAVPVTFCTCVAQQCRTVRQTDPSAPPLRSVRLRLVAGCRQRHWPQVGRRAQMSSFQVSYEDETRKDTRKWTRVQPKQSRELSINLTLLSEP